MPQKNKIPSPVRIKNFWANLRLYDQLTLGYLGLTLLLVTFSPKSLSIKARFLITHSVATVIIIFLVYLSQSESRFHHRQPILKWLQFLRDWHPLFLFSFLLFGEFTHLASLFLPYWVEKYLIRFDFWLFGQAPHQFISQHIPRWGIEWMAFAYWSYYPIVLAAAVLHYFTPSIPVPNKDGKHSPLHPPPILFTEFMNRLCVTFYICFLLFMLLPARSPRHAFNLSNTMPGAGIFFDLVSGIQDYASVIGAAFPSSHVAVAWVAVRSLRQNYRYLYWLLMAQVIALTVSVVILQYHYVLDAVGGVVVVMLLELCWRQQLTPRKRKIAAKMLHFPATAIEKKSVT